MQTTRHPPVLPVRTLLDLALLWGAVACWPVAAAEPVATDDTANTLVNQPVTIPVLANDLPAPDCPLAILRVSKPAHGTVALNAGNRPLDPELSRLFEFAGIQLSNLVLEVARTNQYPRATRTNGTWVTYPVGIYNWVSGFFPGSLWYFYEQSGDARYRIWAENWMAGIAPMQYATQVDDVGFMINPSFGAAYRIVGNPDWRAVVLQTAASFAMRYNGAARVLSTWGAVTNQPFDVFLDTLMNLEVLFHAHRLGGTPDFFTFARNHAEQTMLHHVRADGSTYHIVRYDGKTGAVLSRGTFAGASDESTWARGQAWAIHGFTMAHRETGDPRFLDTAQRAADYYLANLPADSVPYWDFQAPGIPNAPRDSSAAAITLSGLLELSQRVTNAVDSARYWQAARRILDSLGSTNYLAHGTPTTAILLHGVGEPPHLPNPEVDVSLIYGDYYFLEALRRYGEIQRRTTLTYQPDPDFQGVDEFLCQVCDSAGRCATSTVTVVVEPAAASPFTVRLELAPLPGWPVLSFPTTAGRLYHVECRPDLQSAGPWNLLATNVPGTGSRLHVADRNPAGRRFYRVAVETPPRPPQPVRLAAASGWVESPFVITNGTLYQPVETLGVSQGGRALYPFNLSQAGDYVVQATVSAPHGGANSFFVNIDAEPVAPDMIWDIPLTSGFESRTASWRGNGTFDQNQYVPKVFTLDAGPHQLILRGREAYSRLLDLTVAPYP